MQSNNTVISDTRRSAKRVRLIDLPNMPVDTVIPLILSMPESYGVAIAKMCSTMIGNKKKPS